MARALALAARGRGWTSPNPLVGCVIVRDGCVIGEGWHTRYGALHAEREALAACASAGESPAGATAYVTLEPCAHTGKQPPCADALIEAGVARVVVGSPDPNPLVAGKGIARLREAGIQVDEGVLRGECDALNRAFFHRIATGRPLVTAKYAMTLDGKAATRTGASKWVTGAAARHRVHEDRAGSAAIMVGVGTVIADDPMLNARDVEALQPELGVHQPVRVICDPHLRTPPGSAVVRTAAEQPTIIAACAGAGETDAAAALAEAGCRILYVADDGHGRLDLRHLLTELGEQGIDGIIVEGGPTLLGALSDAGLIDRIQAYIAPKVFGGASAPGPIGGIGIAEPACALTLEGAAHAALGPDILIEGDVARPADAAAPRGEASCSQGS